MVDFIVVDLETTGLSPYSDEIIEVGAWKVRNGVVIDKFCTLVKPHIYIPNVVQSMTGITMRDVSDCEPIEVVLPEFLSWCEDLPFLGHNLSFDYNFLCMKGKSLGLDFSLGMTRQGIDTLRLCKSLLRLDSNKLIDVASHFNISLNLAGSGYHRAGYDSYITKLIYDRFLLLYSHVLYVTMPEFLDKRGTEYGRAVIDETLDFK